MEEEMSSEVSERVFLMQGTIAFGACRSLSFYPGNLWTAGV